MRPRPETEFDILVFNRQPSSVRYALAALGVAVATLATWYIPVINQRAVFFIFLFAIFQIALWLGMKRAIMSIVLSLAAANYFFLRSVWLSDSQDAFLLNAIFCTLVALGVVSVRSYSRFMRTLRKHKRDLNRAQAVACIGNWRLDIRRNELLWSDETYRIFGLQKGEPVSYKILLNAVHPEDQQLVDNSWQAAVQGEPCEIEHRIIVDGEAKWVRERVELEFDEDGLLLSAFGTVQDITERQQAKEKLRISETRFKLLADVSAHLLAAENPQTIIGEVCKAVMLHIDCDYFCNYLGDQASGRYRLNAYAGFSAEQANAMEWLNHSGCIVAEDIRLDADPCAALFKTGSIQAYTCYPLIAQGRLLGTLSFGTSRRTTFSNEDLKLLSTVSDQMAVAIQRVMDKQLLALSQKRLFCIVESAMDAIITLDAERHIIMFNNAAEKMFGCSAGEAVGVSMERFMPECFGQIYGENVRYGAQTNVSNWRLGERGATKGLRADGQEFPVEVTISQAEVEGKKLFTIILRDITDRLRAEEAQQERRALQDQLDKVAAAVPGVVHSFRLRADGSTCFPYAASPAFEEVYGLSAETVAEDAGVVFARIPLEDAERMCGSIAESARTMTPWHEVFRYRHPTRGEIWIEGHSVPVSETDGSILWHGYVQDVTERKQAEDELRDSYGELERFNRAAVGRELRIIELKKEVNAYCRQCGLPPPYYVEFENATSNLSA